MIRLLFVIALHRAIWSAKMLSESERILVSLVTAELLFNEHVNAQLVTLTSLRPQQQPASKSLKQLASSLERQQLNERVSTQGSKSPRHQEVDMPGRGRTS